MCVEIDKLILKLYRKKEPRISKAIVGKRQDWAYSGYYGWKKEEKEERTMLEDKKKKLNLQSHVIFNGDTKTF